MSQLTLLDFDTVELQNFARQFIYTEEQLGPAEGRAGGRLAAAVRSRASTSRRVNARVTGPTTSACCCRRRRSRDLRDRRPGRGRSVGQRGVRRRRHSLHPRRAGVHAGAVLVRRPRPQRVPACLERLPRHFVADVDLPLVTWERVIATERVNRGIGPVAQLLGAVVAMEALRYLTRIVSPVAAGAYQLIDFAGSCATSVEPVAAGPGLRRLRDGAADSVRPDATHTPRFAGGRMTAPPPNGPRTPTEGVALGERDARGPAPEHRGRGRRVHRRRRGAVRLSSCSRTSACSCSSCCERARRSATRPSRHAGRGRGGRRHRIRTLAARARLRDARRRRGRP